MKMRIAIAHHHGPMVEALVRHLSADPRLLLAWSVSTPAQAVARCRADLPDLLLLELAGGPDIDSAEAARAIMQHSPCPILIVCPDSDRGLSRAPYAALANGARDAVSESGFVSDPASCALGTKLSQLVRILFIEAAPQLPSIKGPSLLVIGASTGGPAVISSVLRELEPQIAAPCVLIQHIDPEFAPGMATWLQTETGRKTVLAVAGDAPADGTVHLAAGVGHLVLEGGRFQYRREPADTPYQPSIDEFFTSACDWPSAGCAVLMTGMGRDGARGLLALRKKGWLTIAQSPETCAVRGMPQAAIDLGAGQHILDPSGIAALLRKKFHKVNVP